MRISDWSSDVCSSDLTRRQAAAERESNAAAQQLRASIDPVFAAQQRYNQVMQQATTLLMQNKLQTGEWKSIQAQAKAQMDVNVRSKTGRESGKVRVVRYGKILVGDVRLKKKKEI